MGEGRLDASPAARAARAACDRRLLPRYFSPVDAVQRGEARPNSRCSAVELLLLRSSFLMLFSLLLVLLLLCQTQQHAGTFPERHTVHGKNTPSLFLRSERK